MYVKDSIQFNLPNDLAIFEEGKFESVFIEKRGQFARRHRRSI